MMIPGYPGAAPLAGLAGSVLIGRAEEAAPNPDQAADYPLGITALVIEPVATAIFAIAMLAGMVLVRLFEGNT